MTFEEKSFNIESNYKKCYGPIFSLFYLVQGIHQAFPAILPFYLLFFFNDYNIAYIALISALSSLPWSLKFLVGIINDKWGSDKWGHRFPFIIIFGGIAGIFWILMTFTLPLDDRIFTYIIFYVVITNIGVAIADTSLDGLILDVTPKDKLAKVQGYTWSMLMVGNAVAAGLGLIFLWLNAIPFLFLITGITLIISCALTYFITEPPMKEDIHISEDLKRIVTEKKNWTIFAWTYVTAMVYPILMGAFYYYMLISMGIINISDIILSMKSGQAIETLMWLTISIGLATGIGIIISSNLVGKIADKSRKRAIILVYTSYLPFCILSLLFLGFIAGLIANIIMGMLYGGIVIAGQTIRGDITKKYFPELKVTYYALIISFSNLGLASAQLLLAFIFLSLGPVLNNFFILYFIITIICTGLLTVSYLLFRLINPEDYEFDNLQDNRNEETL